MVLAQDMDREVLNEVQNPLHTPVRSVRDAASTETLGETISSLIAGNRRAESPAAATG